MEEIMKLVRDQLRWVQRGAPYETACRLAREIISTSTGKPFRLSRDRYPHIAPPDRIRTAIGNLDKAEIVHRNGNLWEIAAEYRLPQTFPKLSPNRNHPQGDIPPKGVSPLGVAIFGEVDPPVAKVGTEEERRAIVRRIRAKTCPELISEPITIRETAQQRLNEWAEKADTDPESFRLSDAAFRSISMGVGYRTPDAAWYAAKANLTELDRQADRRIEHCRRHNANPELRVQLGDALAVAGLSDAATAGGVLAPASLNFDPRPAARDATESFPRRHVDGNPVVRQLDPLERDLAGGEAARSLAANQDARDPHSFVVPDVGQGIGIGLASHVRGLPHPEPESQNVLPSVERTICQGSDHSRIEEGDRLDLDQDLSVKPLNVGLDDLTDFAQLDRGVLSVPRSTLHLQCSIPP